MNHFFGQQETETQQPNFLLASRQVFDGILHWLANLILLTEDEQRDAGIYLDDQKHG